MLPKSALKSENSQDRKLSLKWADTLPSVPFRNENGQNTVTKVTKKSSSKNFRSSENGTTTNTVPKPIGQMRIFDIDKPPVDIRALAMIPAKSNQMHVPMNEPNLLPPLSELSSNTFTKFSSSLSFPSSSLSKKTTGNDSEGPESPPVRRNIRPPIGSRILPRVSPLTISSNTPLISPPPTPSKTRIARVTSTSVLIAGPEHDNPENNDTDGTTVGSTKEGTKINGTGTDDTVHLPRSTVSTDKNDSTNGTVISNSDMPSTAAGDSTNYVPKTRGSKKGSKTLRLPSTTPITIPSLSLVPLPLPLHYRRYGSLRNGTDHSTTTTSSATGSIVKDDFTFSPLSNHSNGNNYPTKDTVTDNNPTPTTVLPSTNTATTATVLLPLPSSSNPSASISRPRFSLSASRVRKSATVPPPSTTVPSYVTNEELANVLAMVKNQQQEVTATVATNPSPTPPSSSLNVFPVSTVSPTVTNPTDPGTKPRRSRSLSRKAAKPVRIDENTDPQPSVTTSTSSAMSIVQEPSTDTVQSLSPSATMSTVDPFLLPPSGNHPTEAVPRRMATRGTKRKFLSAGITKSTVPDATTASVPPSTLPPSTVPTPASLEIQDMDIEHSPPFPTASSSVHPVTQGLSKVTTPPAKSTPSSVGGDGSSIDPTILSIAALAVANAVADITQKTKAMRINPPSIPAPVVSSSMSSSVSSKITTVSPTTYAKNGVSSTTSSNPSFSSEWKAILNDSSMVMDTSNMDTSMNDSRSSKDHMNHSFTNTLTVSSFPKRTGPVLWQRSTAPPVTATPTDVPNDNPIYLAPLKVTLTPDGEVGSESTDNTVESATKNHHFPPETNDNRTEILPAETTTMIPPPPVFPPTVPDPPASSTTTVPSVHNPLPVYDPPLPTLSPIPVLESVMTTKGTFIPSTVIIQPSASVTTASVSTNHGTTTVHVPTIYTVIPSVTIQQPPLPSPPAPNVPHPPPVASTTSSMLTFDMGVGTMDFSFLRDTTPQYSRSKMNNSEGTLNPPPVPSDVPVVATAIVTASSAAVTNRTHRSGSGTRIIVSSLPAPSATVVNDDDDDDNVSENGTAEADATALSLPSPTFDTDIRSDDGLSSGSNEREADEENDEERREDGDEEGSETYTEEPSPPPAPSATTASSADNDGTDTTGNHGNCTQGTTMNPSLPAPSVMTDEEILPTEPTVTTNGGSSSPSVSPYSSFPVTAAVASSASVSNFDMHYYRPRQEDYTNKLILEDITSVPSDDDDASWCARQHILRVSLFPPLQSTDFVSSLVTLSAGPGTATALGYRPSKQEMWLINQTFNNPAYNDNHNDNVRYDQEPLTLYYHGRTCEKDYPPSCLTTLSSATVSVTDDSGEETNDDDDDTNRNFIDNFFNAWIHRSGPLPSASSIVRSRPSVTPKKTISGRSASSSSRPSLGKPLSLPSKGLTVRPLLSINETSSGIPPPPTTHRMTTTMMDTSFTTGSSNTIVTPQRIDEYYRSKTTPQDNEFSFISTDSSTKTSGNGSWKTSSSSSTTTTTRPSTLSSSSPSSLSSSSSGSNDSGFRRRNVGKVGKYKVKSTVLSSRRFFTTKKKRTPTRKTMTHHPRPAGTTTKRTTTATVSRTTHKKLRVTNTMVKKASTGTGTRNKNTTTTITNHSSSPFRSRPFAGVFDSPVPTNPYTLNSITKARQSALAAVLLDGEA